MLFSTTTHTKPTTTQQENHQNTTTHTTTTKKKKNQRSKRESKKSKSHKNVDQFVGQSKSHKKSKSHRERDRFVGSWRKGSGSSAKLKARGSKVLGRRSVRGFVDRWSRRCDLGSGFVAWSGLSLLPLSLSLSLCVWVWKWFEVKILTETNFRVKAIKTHGLGKIYFPCATKHPHLRKSISESNLKPKQTQP